jgi:GNAT superfamily N-acetyltransferase
LARRRVPDRYRVGITRHRPGDGGEARELAAWWLSRFGAGWLAPERNAWLYERNPCVGPDGPGPWVCRRDGRIVGQQGEVPFDLSVGGELRPAVWAVDLEVDEAHRLRGVGPALIATLLEARPIVAMVDLSEEGYAAFTGAGCADLGAVPVYRRPLDLSRALRSGRAPAALRRLGPAVPVLSLALRLADGLAGAATRLAGARLVPVDRFDERSDEVWDAARPSHPVLARRDHAALAWRIDGRPDADRLRRYYLVRRGAAIGYAVLRTTTTGGAAGRAAEGNGAAVETAVVVDYLAPVRWVAPLLLAAGRSARRDGAAALSVKTRTRADRALRLAGFVRRSLADDRELRLLVHCAEGPPVADLVGDAGAWFLTSTDSNLEHPTAG